MRVRLAEREVAAVLVRAPRVVRRERPEARCAEGRIREVDAVGRAEGDLVLGLPPVAAFEEMRVFELRAELPEDLRRAVGGRGEDRRLGLAFPQGMDS